MGKKKTKTTAESARHTEKPQRHADLSVFLEPVTLQDHMDALAKMCRLDGPGSDASRYLRRILWRTIAATPGKICFFTILRNNLRGRYSAIAWVTEEKSCLWAVCLDDRSDVNWDKMRAGLEDNSSGDDLENWRLIQGFRIPPDVPDAHDVFV